MKKIQLLSALSLVIMMLCSCTNTDYQKAIPASATIVVKADMKSISEKADFKNSKVMKMLDESLVAVVNGKDLKRVREYVDDPMKMGIDFSMPLYFFMVGEETLGLTMKVGNKSDVKDFLQLLNKQGLASKPQEKSGLMCGTLVDDIYYSYDDNTFLLLASTKGRGTSVTSRMARELINLKEEDSFISKEAYDRMNDEEKDVVMCMSSGQMLKNLNLAGGVLQSSLYKDVEALASLNFEKGEVKVTGKLYARTKEAQKMLDEMNDHLEKINGRYLEKVSDDAVIWMGAGAKGEWLLKKIKENKELNGLLFAAERAVDVEQMLRAVDGDVSLELSSNVDRNQREYVLYAELDNSKFLADVDDWKQSHKDYGIEMKDKGKNQYQLTFDGQTYNWGVQGNDLYWATVWALDHAKQSTGALLKPYKEQIENSRIFMFLNWEELVENDNQNSNVAMVLSMLSGSFNLNIKSIYMQFPSVEENSLTIELKDKDENFLKQILR